MLIGVEVFECQIALVVDLFEGIEHGLHVVAGEVGHQPVQAGIVVLLEDAADDVGVVDEGVGRDRDNIGRALARKLKT